MENLQTMHFCNWQFVASAQSQAAWIGADKIDTNHGYHATLNRKRDIYLWQMFLTTHLNLATCFHWYISFPPSYIYK